MKKEMMKALTVAMGVAMSTALVSCDTNNVDDPIDPVVTIESLGVTYSVSLNDTYFTLYDIEANYTDQNGELKTEMITEGTWQQNFTYDYETAPDSIMIKVVGKPQNPMPDFDTTIDYTLTQDCSMSVVSYTSDDKVVSVGAQHNSGTTTIAGETIAEAASREYHILSGKYKPTKN